MLDGGYEMKNINIQKYLQLPSPIQILKHERKTNRNKIRIFEVHGMNRMQQKIYYNSNIHDITEEKD